MKIKHTFHRISYLQYPLMLLALFFSFKPYINGFEYLQNHFDEIIKAYNNALIFAGLAISFSTLQDTNKTQNKFSKKIWENPKKGRKVIIVLTCLTFAMLTFGIFGYFISTKESLNELSFGILVFGIGLIGFLKTGIEIFETHRKDKNDIQNHYVQYPN